MNWTELPTPTKRQLFIVGVEGRNNLWFCDKREYLYHWNGKQWNEFLLPQYDNILLAEYYYSKADGILFAITNKNYHTSYHRFVNERWVTIPFTLVTRTQNFTSAADSTIYIWGDWGSLVHVKKDVWEKITAPFKNHLSAFIGINGNKYLISVRSEGIFSYDGSSFSSVAIPERYRGNIVRFIKSGSTIYALSANQQVLVFNGNAFTESPIPAKEISDPYSEEHFGFSRIPILHNEQQNIFTEIPRNVRVLNHAFVDSNTAVFTTEKGRIFIGEKINTGYFVDVTNVYNVASNPEYPILTAQPSDVNNDKLIDIIAVNKQKTNGATIFFNNANAPFSQDSKLFQTIDIENLVAFASTDINGDSSPDIVTARTDTSGILIDMYEQDAAKGFQHTMTVKAGQLHNARRLTSITSFDYDFDGDNDLVLTFYHNEQMLKGFIVILKNSWWGRSFIVDTSLIAQTRGWNTGISITDLNGIGTPEIIVVNRWGENAILEYGSDGWKSLPAQQYRTIRQATIQCNIFSDIDQDGDSDGIILSDSAGIQLLRNTGNSEMQIDNRNVFPRELTKRNIQWQTIVSADINVDGFPDIVLSTNERNYLLINNNGKKFTDMTKEYHIGNPVAKKLFAGDIDNDGDIDIFGYNDERSVLFENTIDPIGGMSVYQSDIIPGKINGITPFFASIPGTLFRFFVRTEIQFYILAICLNFLLIWIGLQTGKALFQWETNVQLWFVSSNMFLFWIFSAFTYSEGQILKYIFPFVIVVMGTGLPLILYSIVRKRILLQESEKTLHYQLLETVIEFMHGQWAIKNLNGLMLYCSDMAEMPQYEPSMLDQLKQRKTMFFEMTMPRLQDICTLAAKTGIHTSVTRDIQHLLDQIRHILISNSWTERAQLSLVSDALRSLKTLINDYRDKVLKEYSCNPFGVLEQVISIIHNEGDHVLRISLHAEQLKESGKVLVKSFELADIIDNCIRNGVRAVTQPRQPSVSVLAYRNSPKICIDVADNGIGIPEEKWETIFQKGYSENGSTGLGLALARETLQKYGGRIFVKQSNANEGTTFTIELNEVP